MQISSHQRPAAVESVIETAVYVADLERAATFYADVLGLEQIGQEAGRHVFFGVGDGVLLVFDPVATQRGEKLPAHGSVGAGHFALGVPSESLAAWKTWLASQEVEIEQEVSWPLGGWSIYFRDPDGNSVELVTRGIWGRPGGW